MAYTFPLLNLKKKQVASPSSVPNTTQIPIKHVKELGLEVLLRRNGVGARARQILLHNSEHAVCFNVFT